MADFQKGIPDITVVVTKGSEYISSIQPSEVYQVSINTGDNYSVNVTQPHVIIVDGSGSYVPYADYATYALTSSFAQTASYISGSASDWVYITNKPDGIVSSSQQAVSWSVATASYATNAKLPTGVVSSSVQVKILLPTGTVSSSIQINTGSFSGSITSASYALTASYVSGAASQWNEVTNKPIGLVSSSQQAVSWSVASSSFATTASYAANATLPQGIISSSKQVKLNELVGTTFSSSNFAFPQNLTVDGTLFVDTIIASSSVIYESGSTKFGDSLDDTHQFTGSVEVKGDIWVTPGIINELTSSYAIKAENIGVIDAGIYQTGSTAPVAPGTGITKVTSASYALTASYALNAAAGGGGGLTSSLLSMDMYYFVGDGATTNYTLNKEYSSDSLIVTVGGVTFISPNDYTLSSNIISFLDAPYSGSNIFVRGFVNVATNVTGSFSGSFTGIATTASYAITASYISEVVLANVAPPTPKVGSVYFSSSFLYVYDGTQYRSASLS